MRSGLQRTAAAAGGLFAIAVIAPVVAQTLAFTHFVTPAGSATSGCTQFEPCSLTRAVSLIGSTNIGPGSAVLLQYGSDGVYAQSMLTLAGSGTAPAPIKFIGEDGVRITGTRVKPDPSAWTLVAGRQFTYQLDWDAATSFHVSTAAQRPPVTTWRPILVDDRLPPFTQSLGRPFYLEFPIRFTTRASIAQVEAHHCTMWYDPVGHKVYVHMCHDGPPDDRDNLYLGSYGWGTIVINGDYLWLENIAIEQVAGTALKVNPSANGTVLKRIAARASQVWLEGTNTLAEDLDLSHVIMQGIHANQCYDANPDFGAGECWNAAGDGRALLVGRQNRSTSFNQVVRRARVHRSWNGARVDGRNTLEHSILWGFPNHTLEASGTGGIIRDNVLLNGQDSLYLAGEAFDDLTVEHNLFVNGSLFWASKNGAGGVAPKAWRIRYNILPAIVYDDKTFPTVTADCNAWMPSSANPKHLMRVTGTDGRPGADYATLGDIQARTSTEQHSTALPWFQWRDGTLFRYYVGQSVPEFDFTVVNPSTLSACGTTIGPDTTFNQLVFSEGGLHLHRP